MFLQATVSALLLLAAFVWRWCRAKPILDGVKRTVLITGAASGLGREAASKCAKAGDFVVALDTNEQALEDLQQEFGKDNVMVVAVDVTDEASVDSAATRVSASLGEECIDTIACFAGVIRGGPIVEMECRDMALVMNVNVMGTFHVARRFFKLLRRCPGQKSGPFVSPKIVTVASEVSLAWLSAGFNAPYSMSKFAVEALAVSLRQELRKLPDPVSVVVMNPGAMRTPMLVNQKAGGPNAFFEIAARKEGTLFKNALLKGAEVAHSYMLRNASDAGIVGDTLCEIVHDRHPRARYIVGASFEMRYIVPYLPQAVLDFATARQMS